MTNILMRNKSNRKVSRIPMVKLPRSIFPADFSRKQTMKAAYLTPIMCQEVLPSDTWIINMQNFTRLMTQVVAPIDNLVLKTYFFYVPNRLVWDNFTKQQGERENPDDSIDYITPKIVGNEENGFDFKSIYDYMGIPPAVPNQKVSALPFRMYNLIYNEYFRDTDCQDSLTVKKDDSDDDMNLYSLVRKAKMRDYFTNATKETQKGEPVTLPVGTSAPVIGNGMALGLTNGTNNAGFTYQQSIGAQYSENAYGTNNGATVTPGSSFNYNESIGVTTDASKSGLIADLTEALGATVDAFRQMIMTQVLLENDNRGGVRYTELMEKRYGATNPDLRLQRPQYLGGTSTPLFTNPVIQTSSTDGTSPQGNIAGYGTTGDSGNIIKGSFGEFGYIIGLAVVQAIPQYQQGLDKKFSRFDRFDYYYPEFNGLSDQAITYKELYSQGQSVTDENGQIIDDKVFGYIGRYDELRYFKNEICGELRSTYPQSLDSWHYAEKFENLPEYSGEFIQDKTDEILQRSLVVTNDEEENIEEQLITDFQFKGQVYRVLPSKAIPMFARSM